MTKFINNWYNVSVYLSGAAALIAVIATDDITQKLLLISISILFLHFFEEFGMPGGFPFLGMKTLMNSSETDSTKWDCNNLSSMFGNWGFLFLLYVIPLLLPNIRFLTLSAMMFHFAEVLMHLIIFNVKLKTFYNPGFITGVFGLGTIGLYYFGNVFQPEFYLWYDFALAIFWSVAVFIFCFRSNLYWSLGRRKGYALNEQSAYGLYSH